MSSPNFNKSLIPIISDPPVLMFIPLFIAATAAVFFGYLAQDLFIGIGSTFYINTLFTHPNNLTILDGPLTPISSTLLKFLPLATLLILFTLIPSVSTNSCNFELLQRTGLNWNRKGQQF